MTDMTVANTILEQLGGRTFVMLTGAKNLTGSDDTISMKLGSGAKGTHMRITLDPSDTYTLTLLKVRAGTVKEVAKVEMVYCDMLKDVFETMTGLYVSFGRRN